jgi:hypothetical protein
LARTGHEDPSGVPPTEFRAFGTVWGEHRSNAFDLSRKNLAR